VSVWDIAPASARQLPLVVAQALVDHLPQQIVVSSGQKFDLGD
jgi:hypothetical protein